MNLDLMVPVLFAFAALSPGLYLLYLIQSVTEEEARRRIHVKHMGGEYYETEAGAMAIHEDPHAIYLFREK